MVVRRYSSTGTVWRGPTADDIDFALSLVPRTQIIDEGSVGDPYTDGDSVYEDVDPADVLEWSDVEISGVVGHLADRALPLQVSSSNPSVAAVAPDGTITPGSDGTAVITVKTAVPVLVEKRISVAVQTQTGVESTRFVEFVSGSLARECVEQVHDRLDAPNPAASRDLYSSIDHATNAYTRSAVCFLADVDLTAIVVKSGGNGRLGATLVAPDIAITAKHTGIKTGRVLRWVTADNVTRSATVTAHRDIAGTDIRVLLLSGTLTGIASMPVLSSDFRDYLPGVGNRVPIVVANQYGQVGVRDWNSHQNTAINHAVPQDEDRADYTLSLIGGDSGYPACAIIAGAAALLSCHTTAGMGWSVADYITEINAAITDMSSASELTVLDLSAFELNPEPATYPELVATYSPLAYWRMGDAIGPTITDSGGNGHNATATGSPTFGATGLITGDADTAVAFNGSNYATASVPFNPASGNFYVSAWVRFSSVSGVQAILAQQDGAGTGRNILEVRSGGFSSFLGDGARSSGFSVSINTTYHVVFGMDGSTWRFFVNGVASGTGGPISVEAATGNLIVGRNKNTSSDSLSATLDELHLVTGAAPTLGIAQALYAMGTGA